MKKNLMGFVLAVAMLLAGAQNALAQCAGTVYFKAPDDWTQAEFVLKGGTSVVRARTVDYIQLDLSTLSGIPDADKFAIGTGSYIVTDTVWMLPNSYGYPISYSATIPCPGEGNSVYVMEDLLHPGKTYIGAEPLDAKFLHVLLPEGTDWQSDELMIHYEIDGVEKDTVMSPSPDMCGWYRMVFVNVPTSAYFYKKYAPEDKFGMDGLQGKGTMKPINLSELFNALNSKKLFFIPDETMRPDNDSEGWYAEDPAVDGICSFVLAALIYDTDQSLNPVFTSDNYPYASATTGVDACVGIHHGIVNVDLGPDNKPVYSGSAKAAKCFLDEGYFKMLFNYTPGVNEVSCYDIPFRHYGSDTRWGFDSDSMVTNGLVGGFYPVENTTDANVISLNVDGESTLAGPLPQARYKRPASGPVPNNAEDLFGTDLDHVCNTLGYFSGIECEGYFANGDENFGRESGSTSLWCWGSYCAPGFKRWGYDSGDNYKTTETRNQHYCFESHATFTYREDQEFSIRGDDDIWVFINKKLAVDNGGAHLPAPGHVVLKNLNTTYGADFLVPGMDYPIDIFFCDRRTTMSNLIIKTNMNLVQFASSSRRISITPQEQPSGAERLDICYEQSGGDGSCASVALGSGSQSVVHKCGEEIDLPITYSIKTSKGETPSGCSDCEGLSAGQVVHGGIDLVNPRVPVIAADKIVALAPGDYRFVIEIEGKTANYNFQVVGNEDEETSSSSGKTPTSSSSGKTGSSSSKGMSSSSSYADDDFTSPSFHIEMTGPFEFKIVMNEDVSDIKKSYAVMDLQGRVLLQGLIDAQETLVPALSKGSYIVKVGLGHRRVNIR